MELSEKKINYFNKNEFKGLINKNSKNTILFEKPNLLDTNTYSFEKNKIFKNENFSVNLDNNLIQRKIIIPKLITQNNEFNNKNENDCRENELNSLIKINYYSNPIYQYYQTNELYLKKKYNIFINYRKTKNFFRKKNIIEKNLKTSIISNNNINNCNLITNIYNINFNNNYSFNNLIPNNVNNEKGKMNFSNVFRLNSK